MTQPSLHKRLSTLLGSLLGWAGILAVLIFIAVLVMLYVSGDGSEFSSDPLPATSTTPAATPDGLVDDVRHRALSADFGVVYNANAINLQPTFTAPFTTKQPIPNFATIQDVPSKKQAYFTYIGDMSSRINQVIAVQRQFILDLQRKYQHNTDNPIEFTSQETQALAYLKDVYRIKARGTSEVLSQLVHRVNLIPTPLVQVQTANESGWGTSRFAKKGYNFFGLWCYQSGCGFVPKQRTEGMTHEVAKFNSLARAMYRYKLNLNRNRAYRTLRDIRADYMHRNPASETLSEAGAGMIHDELALSHAMIGGLSAYSERGEDYIDELRGMLAFNAPLLESSNAATTAYD